jgi:hypothetical protein
MCQRIAYNRDSGDPMVEVPTAVVPCLVAPQVVLSLVVPWRPVLHPQVLSGHKRLRFQL